MPPTQRKQFNIRLTDEYWEKLERLQGILKEELGVQDVSQAQVVCIGLTELEKKYAKEGKKRKNSA